MIKGFKQGPRRSMSTVVLTEIKKSNYNNTQMFERTELSLLRHTALVGFTLKFVFNVGYCRILGYISF